MRREIDRGNLLWTDATEEAIEGWERLSTQIRREVNQEVLKTKDLRRKEWKEKLEEDWKQGGTLNFSMLKEERQKTIRFLEKPDGSLTAAPHEMHALITDAWVPTVMRKYQAAIPPSVETLKEVLPEFDQLTWKPKHIKAEEAPREEVGPEQDHSFVLPKLTAKMPFKRISKMNKQVPGPDQWSVSSLKAIPLRAWEPMAELFTQLEEAENPDWPRSLTTADLAFLSKGEWNKPIKQRLVTLHSVIYRAYAGARYDQTQEWQDAWEAEGFFWWNEGKGSLRRYH